MNEFGEFICTLRKEKGLTQVTLAEELGVTNKAVSKWETGEAMPETSLLIPLSRILGVTVDELLQGKRNEKQPDGENKDFNNNYKDENTAKDPHISHDEQDESAYEHGKCSPEFINNHLFTRGKDDHESLYEVIGGAVCSAVFVIGVAAYLLLGVFLKMWGTAWVIIPAAALTCGIVGIVFDLFNTKKRNAKIAKNENPYTGAICGIIMLGSIVSYLLIGALADMWHPYWIICACGALACIVIGALGEIFMHKKDK